MKMSTKFSIIAVVAILLVNSSESANIVFIHHMASYSHVVASKPLADALVLRGHHVTYIAAVASSSPNPNITHIVPERMKKHMENLIDDDFSINTRLEGKMPNWLIEVDGWNVEGCEVLLRSEEFQVWMNSTPKVDLIFIDNQPECAMGIAYKLKSKLAIFLPLSMNPKYFDTFGFPTESSSIPTWATPFKTPMDFFDRVRSTLNLMGWRFVQIFYWSSMESLIKEHLEISHLPGMDELYKSISLVLMNGHFMDEHRRSLPPMFVNVPGLHVRENHKPLPTELEEFINSNDEDGNPSEGFIYVSFGTVAKAPNLPQTIRETFFKSMKAFPNTRFLWRWEGEFPKDIPTNLHLSQWFNQQDLLGHSKIRGFVTQTGRPSSQEALYNAVPMITFPILGDQDYNAQMIESLGVSVNLEIGDITEEKLNNAFSTILNDNKLKERSLEVAELYKDLPMRPIDTAVWWTEYVLRHKDFSHLKPLAINQTWYQRRLLDVWAFLTISVLFLSYLIFSTCRLFSKFVITRFILSKNKLKQQ